MAMSIRPEFSPPAAFGMHFLKKACHHHGLVHGPGRKESLLRRRQQLGRPRPCKHFRRKPAGLKLELTLRWRQRKVDGHGELPELIDPVYSINRYGIGAGKSRMLAPDFLAYGAGKYPPAKPGAYMRPRKSRVFLRDFPSDNCPFPRASYVRLNNARRMSAFMA
jgi:hypothetical protein